jgi:FtsH-binding integral membrane protein
MPRAQKIDPEVLARIEMRRAYGLLLCSLAVLCVVAAFVCVVMQLPFWPFVVMFLASLTAGGFLTVPDLNAIGGLVKPLRGSP